MVRPITQKIILNSSQAEVGDPQDTLGHTTVTFQINSIVAASGATIKFQGSNDGNINWIDISEDQVITASGATVVNMSASGAAYWENVRANISSHTDGTYVVYMAASGYPGIK